jgi:NAD(P)H dehydrogenase (quinone)
MVLPSNNAVKILKVFGKLLAVCGLNQLYLGSAKETEDMATKIPKILIMGATGQTGGAVIPHLANHPDVQVVGASRSPAKSELKIPTLALDLDRFETIEPALEGVDRIFMVTGYTVDMLRQSKDLLTVAKKVGVKQIVHLGACGDDDTRIGHWVWHQFIERYIEWSGFTFTHLRPEIFMQNLLGYGGEHYVKQGVIRHYLGHARASWVDCDDIGEAAAACLLNPEKHAGKTYRMGYEAKTCDEVAEVFTEVLGQPFSYEALPPEEFYKKVLAAGGEPAYMKCVYESFLKLINDEIPGTDEVFDNFPAITGRAPGTIADFAKKHADKFRY